MKPRKFNAGTLQEAVDEVRRELGPEAVVLNVRQVGAAGVARLWAKPRVEVVAVPAAEKPSDPLQGMREEIAELRKAVESRDPGRVQARQTLPRELPDGGMHEELLEAGLNPVFARQVVFRVRRRQEGTRESLRESLRHVLLELWRKPSTASPGNWSDTHVFLGPPGAGKTTCLAKRLAQATLLEGRAARVFRLDTFTANADPFLDMHCEVLGVPVHRQWTAGSDLSANETRFIDLPGFYPSDKETLSKVRGVLQSMPGARVHLVLNAAYDASLLIPQAMGFGSLPVTDMVLTHLDEDRRWGKIWNLVMGTNFTISWLGSGQNIPGELAPAAPERILESQLPDIEEVEDKFGDS